MKNREGEDWIIFTFRNTAPKSHRIGFGYRHLIPNQHVINSS